MLCTLVSQWFFAHFVNLGAADLRYIFGEFHSVCHHQLFAKSFALIDWVLWVSFPYNQQPKELRWFWNTPHVLYDGSDTLTARLRIGGYPGKRLIVVLRNLCSTVVGIGFPVYSTHKAIERKSPAEQEQWLVYWAGQFSIIILPSITSWNKNLSGQCIWLHLDMLKVGVDDTVLLDWYSSAPFPALVVFLDLSSGIPAFWPKP